MQLKQQQHDLCSFLFSAVSSDDYGNDDNNSSSISLSTSAMRVPDRKSINNVTVNPCKFY